MALVACGGAVGGGCASDGTDGALLLRACAVAATCPVGLGISQCLQSLGQTLDDPLLAGTGASVARPSLADQVSCLAAATPRGDEACRVTERCQRGSTGEPCGAAPPGCQDDVAQGCDERGDLTQVHCEHAGLTCVEFPGGVDCGLESCDADDLAPRCEGDRAVQCQDGVLTLAFDCAARSLRCAVRPASNGTCGSTSVGCSADRPCVSTCDKGLCRFAAVVCQKDSDCQEVVAPSCVVFDRAVCEGDGATCQVDRDPPRCDGDDRVTCEGGREHRTPCSALPGTRCREGQCRADRECTGLDFEDRCEGDQLVVCQAGRVVRQACRELGLGPCSDGRCSPGGN